MPRTYACCYCNQKFNRYKLPKHMESHESEIPENLTPYQVAYDIINDHPDHHGRCTICGKITNWSSKNQKYHRICRDPKCAQAIKKTYQERMMKVYNKPHLMDDVNHLEKMLASRKISGKYKWSDGTEFTYTGSYEKNFLEFLDKVMNYDSREIISPGPVLEYDYKGKKHKWITDVMILPYNLIVEIKDGGDNKNGNKAWKGTREKTIAKEVMITNLGKYNYIRLTNNDFAQFLGIIAELKMQIVDDTVSPLYRIHENANLILDSKEDREKLLDFTQNEIRELPREKDTKFIWPDQLMQSKRGNCVDVALLWYDYCKKRNRDTCLIRIGYSYKHSNSNNTSLSHQFHVMCMYKEDDGNWCIVNNVGPNKLSKELFIGNKSKESTISLFAKEFLPCLKGYVESIYPDAIIVEPIIEIAPDDKMNKFYSTYFNKYNGNKQLFMKNIFTEDTSLNEAFEATKAVFNLIKDNTKKIFTGKDEDDKDTGLKGRIEGLIFTPFLATFIPVGLSMDGIIGVIWIISKIFQFKEKHKTITQKDIDELGKAIEELKDQMRKEEKQYEDIYRDFMAEKSMPIERALPGLVSIYEIPENKMIAQLSVDSEDFSIVECDLKDSKHPNDIAFYKKYKGMKCGWLTEKYGDGMLYCFDTKEWFLYSPEAEGSLKDPHVISKHPMKYKEFYKELRKMFWSQHRDYKDQLKKLEDKYKEYKSRYSKQSVKESSIPEVIDNPYMLREAQEWEHLTHMWDNAIDDIIGNVTNSPFEVNKGSYIDHDPETGKEVCVMRTIRPKEELKNREYRDKLKRQMYKLQQKINKAYNVHPSVMFIQYPIDNTNLTEGLIIGITKTSR